MVKLPENRQQTLLLDLSNQTSYARHTTDENAGFPDAKSTGLQLRFFPLRVTSKFMSLKENSKGNEGATERVLVRRFELITTWVMR